MPPMACRLSRTVRHFDDDGMGEVRCDGYEGQMLLANYLRGSNFDIVEHSYPERRSNNELDASFLFVTERSSEHCFVPGVRTEYG